MFQMTNCKNVKISNQHARLYIHPLSFLQIGYKQLDWIWIKSKNKEKIRYYFTTIVIVFSLLCFHISVSLPNISVQQFKSEISKRRVVSCGRYARIFPLLDSSVIRVILLFPQIIAVIF